MEKRSNRLENLRSGLSQNLKREKEQLQALAQEAKKGTLTLLAAAKMKSIVIAPS